MVRASIEHFGTTGLRIDPRPLRPIAALQLPRELGVEELPTQDLKQRMAVLHRFGIMPVDAKSIGMNSTCAGIFVLPDPQDSVGDRSASHRYCPSTQLTILAIGSPRPGTSNLPSGQIYDRSTMDAAMGYEAVRIVKTVLVPDGSSVSFWDFIVRRQGDGWHLVDTIGLFVAE